jgi:ABC-2 type transport system ATP-binding protein
VTNTWAIETESLRKLYDGVEAVSDMTLKVPPGSIFGFLGRNGAGKTTTIKMLLGMARLSSGRARVLGLDAGSVTDSVKIRQRTGFVSEDKALFDYMTAGEMIRFTAGFYPLWDRDLERKYLGLFQLRPDAKTKTLSQGTRSRLSLLLALCRGAELLILDEPTSGLDPAMTEEVLQTLVIHVARRETTVFFSSHQIAEVDQIADHIAIVRRGRVALSGGLDDFLENYRRMEFVFEDQAPVLTLSAAGVLRTTRNGRTLTVLSSAGTEQIANEIRPYRPVSVDINPVSLKEVFLDTVKEDL